MKLQLFMGLAILAVASSARIARDAPPEDNFIDKVENGLKDVEKLVLDVTGAANTEELKQKAEEHLEIVVNQFHSWAGKIKEETEHLQENDMIKDLRHTIDTGVGEIKDKVNQRIAKFKEEQPETYNQISNHVETVKKASTAIVAKIEELTNSEDAKRLKETSLKFIDDIKKSLLDVATEVKEGEKTK